MVYTANWVIIWYLPPIQGTRKLHWLADGLNPFENYESKWEFSPILGGKDYFTKGFGVGQEKDPIVLEYKKCML